MVDHGGPGGRPAANIMSREIGSLRTLENGESQYVGSSSGVYFINTVRRAFAAATSAVARDVDREAVDDGQSVAEAQENPSPEDCLVGNEQRTQGEGVSAGPGRVFSTTGISRQTSAAGPGWHTGLRSLPDRGTARQLVLTYFRIWHPLVPFLHGPSILNDLDSLYGDSENNGDLDNDSLSRLVTYKCIFSIAALDHEAAPDREIPVIRSASVLFSALGPIALRCDIKSIQALLSAQLHFVATMALRSASSVGGLITKAIVQSGMHRCPYRYWHLPPDDRTMRKRTFWSAYVLDRFLSQSLGHPLGIQDSDIDVCLPGARDLHEPVAQSELSPASVSADNTILHLAVNHPERCAASPRLRGRDRQSSGEEEDQVNGVSGHLGDQSEAIQRHRRDSQAVLDHHVRYSQLIGRMLEIYHKSIHVRGVKDQTVVFLKADVSAWGNMLSQPPTKGPGTAPRSPGLGPDPTIFPLVSYKYARLLINRPSLSLDPTSADFRNSIQVCVGAATAIIQTLETYKKTGGALFWPGYMSAVWMSGLILAFAARLQQYTASRAIESISSALGLLAAMTKRWRMAGHCREVLSTLLEEIRPGSGGRKRSRVDAQLNPAGQESPGSLAEGLRGSKRQNTQAISREAHSSAARRLPNGRDASPRMGSRTPRDNSTPGNNTQPSFLEQTRASTRAQSGRTPGAETFDPNTLHGGSSQLYKYPQLSQPDFDFNFFSFDDPDSSSATQHLGQFHTPIPTTFPDRHRSQQNQGLDQMDYFGSTYNIFDGATWGPLIDLVGDDTSYL